jgi:hypothetical protein
MKRLAALVLAAILVPVLPAMAQNHRNMHNDSPDNGQASEKAFGGNDQEKQGQPVVINMNNPSSGGQNRNFPSQMKKQPAAQNENSTPSYGKLQRTGNKNANQRSNSGMMKQHANRWNNAGVKSQASNFSGAGDRTAFAAHHVVNKENFVNKRLQKIGVKAEPGYITKREEVIHTDRQHSMIAYPKIGFDNHPLRATAFSSRNFNDKAVRSQMSLIVGASWNNRVIGFNHNETTVGRYYWHQDKGFDYCHFIDNSGYHWYGWYTGGKYFWTRNFNNRWWWYDTDFDRWCFWNNGFWWWQDPYHIGDLYCYNDTEYIPLNSSEDDVAVTVPENSSMQTFKSPDNTRLVKVVAETNDAFLYDTSNPPQFSPIYLASGVKDVIFSDTNNGKPLEIILKLSNSSFDMFDGYGNPYNTPNTEE